MQSYFVGMFGSQRAACIQLFCVGRADMPGKLQLCLLQHPLLSVSIQSVWLGCKLQVQNWWADMRTVSAVLYYSCNSTDICWARCQACFACDCMKCMFQAHGGVSPDMPPKLIGVRKAQSAFVDHSAQGGIQGVADSQETESFCTCKLVWVSLQIQLTELGSASTACAHARGVCLFTNEGRLPHVQGCTCSGPW